MMSPAIRQSARLLQGAMSVVFPLRCGLCDAPVVQDQSLCGECFAEATFLGGLTCDLCGTTLPGESKGAECCDDCLTLARPWKRGRAAMAYEGTGRRLILRLKHADRPDLARMASGWMVRAGADVLKDSALVPVPAHWSRRIARRYNQSAELSRWIARRTGLTYIPLALRRTRATPGQDHKTLEQRFANLEGAIEAADPGISGRRICLVDDVMASGATLSACARALLDAGAKDVSTLVLARVVKRP